MSHLFSVEGKTVLVTGGSSGIGRMIVDGFVRAGAAVYLSSRKAAACDEVADELSRVGECTALPADLGSEAGCHGQAEAIGKRVSRLDVLVNNAGTIWMAPIADHDDRAWDKVLSLNLKAAFHLTRFMMPLLEAAAESDAPARIINIGSTDALRVPPMESYAYTASKAGLHDLTRHLAWRLAPRATVNAIAPGTFPSRMSASFLEDREAEVAASIPLGRIGRLEDAAGTAIFLSSRAGAFVTGAIIPVDGGMSALR